MLEVLNEIKKLNNDVTSIEKILNDHKEKPYYDYLKLECGLILYKLAFENDNDISNITEAGITLFKDKLSKISKSFIQSKLDDAESEIIPLIEMIERYNEFENTSDDSYYTFTSDLEILLYMAFCGSDDRFRIIPYDFASVYNLNGVLNLRRKEVKLARVNFQRALRWNPLDMGALYQMVETYKLEDDWHRYYQEILKAIDITYETRYLSIAYKMLGDYFSHLEKYQEALAMYGHSLAFKKDNQESLNQIKVLQEKHKLKFKASADLLLNINQQYNVPLYGSEKLKGCLVDFYQYLIERNSLLPAYDVLTVIYNLTQNESIKAVLDELKVKIEQK